MLECLILWQPRVCEILQIIIIKISKKISICKDKITVKMN